MKKQLAEVVDETETKEIAEQEILYSCENNGAKDLCSTKKDATCGVCSGNIKKTLVIFAEFSMKTKVLCFDVDIANFRNKRLKSEILVRVGIEF